METYFVLPQIGELTLEHVFYLLDSEPILFVCKDLMGHRYLCSCCLMYQEWVVGRTEESALLSLIDDKTTIRDIFVNDCDSKYLVWWDGENFKLNSDVPDGMLPKVGATLELEQEKTGPYRETLRRIIQLRALSKVLLKADGFEWPGFLEHFQISADLQKLASALSEFTEYFKSSTTTLQDYHEILSLAGTMRRLDDADNICNRESAKSVSKQSFSIRAKHQQKAIGRKQAAYQPICVDCFAA